MKNYQYVLFDWDGCLAQTLQTHLNAYKETFAEYDIFPDDREITREVFGDWNGPAKLGVSDVPTFTENYLARLFNEYPQTPLYPHVHETLVSLKESGKDIVLVTTSTRRIIEPALTFTKMTDYFKFVLAAEDVNEHKPAPEIIEKSLEKLRGEKEKAIIIGDSKSDLGAAKNAGIDSVLFSPSDHAIFYDKQELIDAYNPNFVITDHFELIDILKEFKNYI